MNTIHPAGPSATPAEVQTVASDPLSGPAASGAAHAEGVPAAAPPPPAATDAGDRASLQSAPDVGHAEPFDEGRVNLLRTQISSGQYHVDARATAGAMLSQMLDFHGIG